MASELPAADPASPWMQHLERAHSLAHAVARLTDEQVEPNAYFGPAARDLERAMSALYDAFDGRADRVTAINVAHGRLWSAAVLLARGGLLSAVATLRDACVELINAERRFPKIPLAPRPPEELRAAVDLLPLHVVERPSVVPSFRAPPAPEVEEKPPAEPLPKPTTFEELATLAKEAMQRTAQLGARPVPRPPEPEPPRPPPAAPPGFAFPPPLAIGEDAFVRSWTRHCFEEIGMLGMQRTPLAGDDWRTSSPIERRLLHAVDAIAALGPQAVASLEPIAMDAPVANPMTVFAIALLGGCLEGRDVLGSAERVLFRFGANDPLVAEPFVSAMKLAPSPYVPSMLRSLLVCGVPGCKAVAAEVMAYRGWLTEAEMSMLAEDADPRVVAPVLSAMARSQHRELRGVLDRALQHADGRVQAAALDAMALAAHPDAASAARAAACGSLGDEALVRLSLVADEDDARWLMSRVAGTPSAAVVEALGWAGHLDAVPVLLDLLESGDEEGKLAAGAALERLLGAGLVDRIEVAPEAVEDVVIVDPDPDPPKRRPPLAALVSHQQDMPSAGSPETIEVPSVDPARWRAYWADHGSRLDRRQRFRRGRPHGPSVLLFELDRLPLSPEDRRRLHRELAAQTGEVVAFDPHDLVVVQEKALSDWGAVVKATREVPGSWGTVAGRG